MTISKLSTIVSTHWVREQIFSRTRGNISKVSSHLKVLDTSWLPDPDVDGHQFYREAHIPQSLYFNLSKVSPIVEGSTERFKVPDSNLFQDYVESLGISNDTHVVTYDRFNTRAAFRTWFLFRLFGHDTVSVLNGGLKQWVRDGFHVSTEVPSVKRGTFDVKFQPQLLRDFDAMMKIVETGSEQIVDARGPDGFYITDDDTSGGHIPGAKSIPFSSIFNEDGTVKSKKDLQKLMDDAGVDLNKPIVSSCLLGLTACGLIAAAHILGKTDVPLYNGSFYEWRQRAEPSKIVRIKKP